jgi:tetratricopeptide (TPR) repeat protein
MTMRALLTATLVASFLVASSIAAAEPNARELYESGARAYAEGRYDEAIGFFERAHALDPQAALAFNLGQAYEKAGQLARAAQSFREYLRREAFASDAKEVEARIADLERRSASSSSVTSATPPKPAAKSTAPAAVTTDDAVHEQRGVRVGTWIAFAAGAGSLGAALGFELARQSAEDDIASARTQLGHQQLYDEAKRQQDFSRLFAGIGAAATITGGVLLYLDLAAAPRAREMTSTRAHAGYRLTVGGIGTSGFGMIGQGSF